MAKNKDYKRILHGEVYFPDVENFEQGDTTTREIKDLRVPLLDLEDKVVTLPFEKLIEDIITESSGTIDNKFLPLYVTLPTYFLVGEDEATYINLMPTVDVKEFELPIFITVRNIEYEKGKTAPQIQKFVLNYKGKGKYGIGGQQLIISDLILLYEKFATPEEIVDILTTQYIDLGEIGNSLISVVLNISGDRFIQDQALGYRVFRVLRNGVKETYLFGAVGGVYGATSVLTAVEEDFEPFGNTLNSGVMSSDFIISLENGKNYGKYLNGQTVPCAGWSFEKTIKDIGQENLLPTVELSSTTVIEFNQTAINNVLNFSYIINSLGATVDQTFLEYRRGNAGSWIELSDDTSITNYVHTLTDSDYNSQSFNYRYTVIDSNGTTGVALLSITPKAYIPPAITLSTGFSQKEKGDVAVTLTGSIAQNSPYVELTSYKLQMRRDNESWEDITSEISITNNGNYISFPYNNSALINASTVRYRALVTTPMWQSVGQEVLIQYIYRNVLGYNAATELTLPQILALANPILSNAKARTVDPVTAGVGLYTYYAYNASAADLTDIILVTTPILGAFTKLADVTGVNSFGATVTYRVYKSNSTNAFTNNKLIIT
jgi:hypothetical protein